MKPTIISDTRSGADRAVRRNILKTGIPSNLESANKPATDQATLFSETTTH